MKNIVIIGCSGAIGQAITQQCRTLFPDAVIHGFSQTQRTSHDPNMCFSTINYRDERSIQDAAESSVKNNAIDMIIVTIGMLHTENVMPEKSLRDLTADKFQQLFAANTIAPALIAKHFLPYLRRDQKSIFAALSARVGSISDNQLGGWYAYRASKAALNMVIKNAAIEIGRRNKKAIIVGLHPGTVDSALSKPFQNHVPKEQLFTPDYSAKQLLNVLQNLETQHTGKCFAWDGEEILP